MFPRYYNLVVGLRPFSAVVSPVSKRLVRKHLPFTAQDREVKEANRQFLEWVVAKLIFDQFLTEVRGVKSNSLFEDHLYYALRREYPDLELDFGRCVRALGLRMTSIPDSVRIHYDGFDAFLLDGRDSNRR